MPNWVKNKVTFIGQQDEVNLMLESIKTEESNNINYFDFEKIIPMPESLKIESGSKSDIGFAIVKHLNGDSSELEKILSYSWTRVEKISTIDDLIEYFKSSNNYDYDELIKFGEISLENIKNYGHSNWYDWSCEKWGTKWNSSESFVDENTIWFETAWSTPEPVMIELSNKFPNINFIIEYADEDIGGGNTGKYELKAGKEILFELYDGIKACEVWGYDPMDYFPNVFRDNRIDEILGDE